VAAREVVTVTTIEERNGGEIRLAAFRERDLPPMVSIWLFHPGHHDGVLRPGRHTGVRLLPEEAKHLLAGLPRAIEEAERMTQLKDKRCGE
jgi:hypothetical protein